MDLVGMKVRHKVFGAGTVTAFDESEGGKSGYVTVEFSAKTSKFLYPDAFEKFLTVENEEVNTSILEEIAGDRREKEKYEEKIKLKEAIKQQVMKNASKPKPKAPKTIDDFFGLDYHSENLKREPILTYRDVEGSFGIKTTGLVAKDIYPTETNVVLISNVTKIGGKFVYRDRFTPEGDYIYTGEGKKGDQTMTGGNLAIINAAEDRKDIHLFVKLSPAEYYYQGIFTLADYNLEEGKDEAGNFRLEYKFRLTPRK
ncbi:MAG: hypothetical protein IKU42_07695 [Oscillospiraceae bacterium]|nr:hypothetical protein [Oscillospiraceae bacterium]